MAFTIPNEPSAFHADQAELDSVDLDVVVAGFGLTGILNGCAVTAQGSPDMTCAVAAGQAIVAGTVAAVTAGNVTITAADATNPRIDLVVVNSSGTKSVTAGTASAQPVMPAISTNVALAAVYVPATDTTIASNQITDKRILLTSSPFGRGTTFPTTPVSGDQFERTDIQGGMRFRYDGTRWRSDQIFNAQLIVENNSGSVTNIGNPRATSGTILGRAGLWKPTYDVYLLEMRGTSIVVTTNDGTKFWTVSLKKGSDNTTIGSFTTAADTVDIDTNHLVAINAVSTEQHIYILGDKTSTPGNLYLNLHVTYQLIAT